MTTTKSQNRREVRIVPDVFYTAVGRHGATLATNPFFVDARQQGLKDTYALFAVAYLKGSDGKLPNGVVVRDYSSGNYPLYFPGRKISRVKDAMLANLMDESLGGYRVGEEGARETVGAYYGVPGDQVFFCNGISGGIEMFQEAFLHKTGGGRILIVDETYPTHFSFAQTFGGNERIVTIPRHQRTRQPDLSQFGDDNNPFSQVAFSTFITHENPNPIVHAMDTYRNDDGTGIFDLNERAAMYDGILRPVVLDMIYGSFSWPKVQLTAKALLELSDGKNILVFYNGLAKAGLEPAMRAGSMAVYVPPRMIREVPKAAQLIADLKSKHDRLLCGTSRVGAAGLAAFHVILEEEKRQPDPELEALRMEARLRFIGTDGKHVGNHTVMCSVPYIEPMHPEVDIESSGYNLYRVVADDLPWTRTEYKARVLRKLDCLLEALPESNDREREKKAKAQAIYSDYLNRIAVANIAASDIFCLELLLEKGVVFAPVERFYKLGTEPTHTVAFRPVMIAEPDAFKQAADLLGEFLREKLD